MANQIASRDPSTSNCISQGATLNKVIFYDKSLSSFGFHFFYFQGNQYFRFDIKNLHIFWGRKRNNLCLDADHDTVFINTCEKDKTSQHWMFGFIRASNLRNWSNFGAPILDEVEKRDLLNNMEEFITETQSEEKSDDNEFCE